MRLFVAAILCLATAGPAAAQTPPAADGRKTVQLSKLYYDTQSAQTKGKLHAGLWCISNGPWKWTNPGRTLVHNDQFDFKFTQELAQAGYLAVSHVQDMFDTSSDNNTGANYLIGAELVPDTMDICSSVNGFKGTVILNVEFKLYDTAAKAVVLTFPTSGQVTIEKFTNKTLLAIEIDAFGNALDNLVKSGSLNKYLGAPKPVPPVAIAAPVVVPAAAPAKP